ncbi:hypothetical protein EVAR_16069_1 [Eumeta japonica]|uniref:Uncharacterized protein n=1 Tax=Eumeta variegata TaxID=151549 RepID=A0A4C1UIH2_EUMVA|nr:hypothetical protein EVAR_16069_1 [Eumeta japonica]
MQWSTRLQHVNGPAQPVKYHTFTEYRREVNISGVGFRSVSECYGGSLTHHLSKNFSFIGYLNLNQKSGNALMSPLSETHSKTVYARYVTREAPRYNLLRCSRQILAPCILYDIVNSHRRYVIVLFPTFYSASSSPLAEASAEI